MMKKLFLFFILSFSMMPCVKADQSSYQQGFDKGYISSKLEDRFPQSQMGFDIQGSSLIVYDWPEYLSCGEIKHYLEGVQDYSVIFDSSYEPLVPTLQEEPSMLSNQPAAAGKAIVEGEFLPEFNPFFPTMLAQPHIIGYSAGYRSYDRVFRTSCLPVSIGDQFSLYQFKPLSLDNWYLPLNNWYLGLEACVWAIFEARYKSLSLINADYFVAIPFTYINNNFSAKLRIFHQSSHLGDEFLLENPKIHRVNPSMEVVELEAAYDFSDQFTVFAGYSRVLRSDKSFKVKPNGVHYGFNYYLNFLKLNVWNVQAVPYIAAYFNNLENNRWHLQSNVAIGYQWDKLYGHKLRAYIEGHSGNSEEGQFQKRNTKYLAFKILYGY